MAYYMNPDGEVIGTLIDFDLATYPEEEAQPFIDDSVPTQSLTEESSASTTCTPRLTAVGRKDTNADEDETLKNGQDRSGTAPFMAIEALDLTAPGYKHHVCHELESIFYALIWHGVGYRYRRKKFPRPPRIPGFKKQPDHLRRWRVGQWASIKGAKVQFLHEADQILQYVRHDVVKAFGEELVTIFRTRLDAALLRRDAARTKKNASIFAIFHQGLASKGGATASDSAEKCTYELAVYPSFARALHMKVTECKLDCCVSTLLS